MRTRRDAESGSRGAAAPAQRGLSFALSREEFLSICKFFADSVFDILKSKCTNPTASCLFEKTPDNAFCAKLITTLYRGAKVIHIIRDPRAVVSSLLAASNSWGRTWAPDSVVQAARLWSHSNQCARKIENGNPNYMIVKFEDLKRSANAMIHEIARFLEIDSSSKTVDMAIKK